MTNNAGWPWVANVAIGLAFAAIGLVFAINFNGLAEWYTRVSYQSVGFLRQVPPWRWLVKDDEKTLIKRGVKQSRFTGLAFLVVGLGIAVSGVVRAFK